MYSFPSLVIFVFLLLFIFSSVLLNICDKPNAESILKSKVIRDRMAPFLKDNKFDYETASKFIKQYEENKNKIKNKKKKEENEIVEKNYIISLI